MFGEHVGYRLSLLDNLRVIPIHQHRGRPRLTIELRRGRLGIHARIQHRDRLASVEHRIEAVGADDRVGTGGADDGNRFRRGPLQVRSRKDVIRAAAGVDPRQIVRA